MPSWPFTSEGLRAMYVGGRGNLLARRLSHIWSSVFALGLAPRRWICLEVAGRRSGRVRRFPLGMADLGGEWYLVSMLGDDCNWVRNVRAAGGEVSIRHGRRRRCRLVEVPAAERPPVLRRYLEKVPGGRPHIPVEVGSSALALEAVAGRFPVFRVAASPGAPGERSPRPAAAGPRGPGEMPVTTVRNAKGATTAARPRRRHRRLRIAAGVVMAAVVVLALAGGLSVKLTRVPGRLALPATPAAAPVGSLPGTWRVAAGSMAGFRVRETVVFMSNDIVGRTGAVTGSVVVRGTSLTAATLRLPLDSMRVGGKVQPAFGRSLDATRHPTAIFVLSRPIALPAAFATGATCTRTATGHLSLGGVSRLVTFAVSSRRDGAVIEAVGSIPLSFSAWGIARPAGVGPLGSLAGNGLAEFLLVLRRP